MTQAFPTKSAPVPLLISILLGGCSGPQSALDPHGSGASQIADLFFVMVLAGCLIWVAIIGVAIIAARSDPKTFSRETGNRYIAAAGLIFPTVAIAVLLAYALSITPLMRAAPKGLNVEVEARQYWWKFRYQIPDSTSSAGANQPQSVDVANHLVLPVDESTHLQLKSPDVIHSFWAPALNGKMDLIPGRSNELQLEPKKLGHIRGQCAEFCGLSHSYMSFDITILPKDEFDRWLRKQAAPAVVPDSKTAERGRDLFFREGCQACHAIRGTPADGQIGPDLTHFASRKTLGAGVAPISNSAVARWISNPGEFKPGVKMPAFSHLEEAELQLIAEYLVGLE